MRLIEEYKRIKCRADFYRALNAALVSSDALLQRAPGDGVVQSIKEQLQAMQRWTAGGREPTQDERWGIRIGLLIHREIETVDDDQVQDWAEICKEVAGYFRHWLDDSLFATVDVDEIPYFRRHEDPKTHLQLPESVIRGEEEG